MESIISHLLFQNWQRKTIALIAAIIVWIFVNQSISETKIIPNIPVKVINLPQDKTINGLLPNGYLSNRLTLTLSGSKDVINELEPGDLEILLDASTASSDDWVVQVTKKNLVSLNPSIDLRHYINHISHPEFVIKLNDLITDTVPIWIEPPTGTPPHGYEFLDIWPKKLTQTISGSKEAIQELKINGLNLVFNMDNISSDDLERIQETQQKNHDNEISYFIPEKWKKIPIPFRNNSLQEINDPDAKNLRIDFLKKQILLIGKQIPITVFFPLKYSAHLNPETVTLKESSFVAIRNGIQLFNQPLYAKNVSRLFLDIVKENMMIVLVAAPQTERKYLQWSVEVVNSKEMEDTYVAYIIAEQKENGEHISNPFKREQVLRKRFRNYMQKLALFTQEEKKLSLYPVLNDGKITLETVN